MALSEADRDGLLEATDVERLAIAAFLIGRDAENIDLLARGHQAFLAAGDPARAARCAFWLGFRLMDAGDQAQANGWLGRARRLLDDGGLDCAERGYLLLPTAIHHTITGQFDAARATFADAVAIGERFQDRDLVILARHGEGRALIMLGRTAEGTALLDEVMVAVTSGDAGAIVVGTIYCSVLSVCSQIFDVRRAREWTAALTRWCATQPDLVPFRGECLVRRAEVLRLQGAWPEAMQEAQRANEVLPRAPGGGQPIIGAAFYQMAELHRLRGEFAQADEAYRQAGQWWRKPQPGPALLRLDQGQVDAARAAIRRVLDEAQDPKVRAGCLGACVEILLAAGDVAAARAAADELSGIATRWDAPFLNAVAAHARGEVLLAAADPRAALPVLRAACAAWIDLDAPYEVARCRLLLGRACRAVGDHDAADVEFAAARQTFHRLGAQPDLARLDALTPAEPAPGGLSARELQVLRLIAAGKSNRDIARDLAISEKTVARHVSNIFTKLDLSSRTAAAAYAYRHGLARP